jgi:hypothetical protein
MIAANQSNAPGILHKGFLAGVLLGLALVLAGRILVPAAGWPGTAAASLVLVAYGLAGTFGFTRIPLQIWRPAALFGLLAGGIFAGEILLEFALLPQDNTRWGLVEFGSVFAVFLISSLVAAWRSKSTRAGILAALVSAMISSLIWLAFLFLTLYLFRGTARLDQVLKAEGTYEDFARSGMLDFNAFVMEDYYGAAFFHLLLGPLAALILGTPGGIAGKFAAEIPAKRGNQP